jgi:hypothetical protein
MDVPLTLEEALRQLEDRAALLRYLAASAAINPEPPDRAVFAGMGELSADIERMARCARKALDADTLCAELKRPGGRRDRA